MKHLAERLLAIRAKLPPQTSCCRWVHGDELTVDWFGPVAVMSLYVPKSAQQELEWAHALVETGLVQSVYVKRRPKEARRSNEAVEELAPPTPLVGERRDELEVEEAGSRFIIRPGNGLSVGLYLDAREARAWVRRAAKGKVVANFFAYTCGFGVAALAGGAERALNVDVSRRVLEWGKENVALNGATPQGRDFVAGDAFEWLGRLAKKGDTFDLLVLDPPGFATTSKSRFSAAADYHRLVAAAVPVVKPGGWILAMCNVASLPSAQFDAQLLEGARGWRIVERFDASEVDFPGSQLKCRVLQEGRS